MMGSYLLIKTYDSYYIKLWMDKYNKIKSNNNINNNNNKEVNHKDNLNT
jgi:hypothetical protein